MGNRARLVVLGVGSAAMTLAACGSASRGTFAVSQVAGEAAHEVSLGHPEFLRKLRDPAGYRVDRSRLALESICGTDDLQTINAYDGLLGQSVGFARLHKRAVGAMTSEATQDGAKYCSGTMVSPDLFLTANHCTDADTVGQLVAFNYEQLEDGTGVATQEFARVTEVVDGGGSLDYAVLKLEGEPGLKWGWADLRTRQAPVGELLTIIQHPQGGVKKIEVGHLLDFEGNYMRYGDLDTEPGSSGSGVLDSNGFVVGVHTNGGCSETDGANSGVRLNAAAAAPVLAGLNAITLPFVDGSDIDLVAVGQDGARMILAADAATGRVGLVPEAESLARGLSQWRVMDMADGTIALYATETRERTWILTAGTDGGVAIADGFNPADVAQRWRIQRTAGDGYAVQSGVAAEGAVWAKWLAPEASTAGGIALSDRAKLWDLVVR